MTDDERTMAAVVARLRGEIREDRALLARCIADADQARMRLAVTPDDPAVLALGAVAVHGWYTGLETVLERIARQIDREVPQGTRRYDPQRVPAHLAKLASVAPEAVLALDRFDAFLAATA